MTNVLVTVAFLASAVSVARSGNARIAGLLALTGATWWLGDLVPVAALLHRGPLVHLLLAYPEGRLGRRHERVVVAAVYVTGAWIEIGSEEPVSLATGVVVVACVLDRWARARGQARRARAAPAIAGAAAAALLAVGATGRLLDAGIDMAVLRAYEVVLIATAVGLAADLRFGDWRSSAITGLVVELGAAGDQTLSARLGRVLGDPTLVVAFPVGRETATSTSRAAPWWSVVRRWTGPRRRSGEMAGSWPSSCTTRSCSRRRGCSPTQRAR